MRWILDSNSLIYLIKADLEDLFYKLTEKDIVIDTSVFHEVVEVGIKKKYPVAERAKNFLERYRIPIISIDISSELGKFRDPGETSCYLLTKKEGVCISSDVRATKKFSQFNLSWMQLDTFFYQNCLNKKILMNEFEEILEKLEKVQATTPERKYALLRMSRSKD